MSGSSLGGFRGFFLAGSVSAGSFASLGLVAGSAAAFVSVDWEGSAFFRAAAETAVAALSPPAGSVSPEPSGFTTFVAGACGTGRLGPTFGLAPLTAKGKGNSLGSTEVSAITPFPGTTRTGGRVLLVTGPVTNGRMAEPSCSGSSALRPRWLAKLSPGSPPGAAGCDFAGTTLAATLVAWSLLTHVARI